MFLSLKPIRWVEFADFLPFAELETLGLRSKSQLVTPLRTKQFLTSRFDLSLDNSIYSHITSRVLNNSRVVFLFCSNRCCYLGE